MARLPWFLLLLSPLALAGAPDDDEEEDALAPSPAAPTASPPRVKYRVSTEIAFEGMDVGGTMSATVGGAQDVRYFRDAVRNGEVPHPATFTPEGLFSEHDLPVPGGGRCVTLLCPVAAAAPASLTIQPEVRWLAQLGFHTGIDEATFRRAPLNLVAVVDKSGSMSGQPLAMVKATLHDVVGRLGPDDQLSIVLYGDRAHVHLEPTRGSQVAALHRAIDAVESAGSTYMEQGLQVGFDLAQRTARTFDGATRVMLFTDERPNVGRTDAQSFMGLAEAGSRAGVGMTTIGVGVQFGAELATKVSSVRGGNLFFFPTPDAMHAAMDEEFDTMVTELAYDMRLRVTPAPGVEIAGVYGIPGDAVRWDQGALELRVATLFPSREEGGIYFAFAPKPGFVGQPRDVGVVSLDYERPRGAKEASSAGFVVGPAPVGLVRGQLLVEEATVLKQATTLHHQHNDQEGAYQLVRGLAARLRAAGDPELADEVALTSQLEATLARLSGHQGESAPFAQRDPITGLPR